MFKRIIFSIIAAAIFGVIAGCDTSQSYDYDKDVNGRYVLYQEENGGDSAPADAIDGIIYYDRPVEFLNIEPDIWDRVETLLCSKTGQIIYGINDVIFVRFLD